MADIKTKYGSSAAFTIDLTSLASSATRVAGRESTAINNETTLALDYLIAGKIRGGTTPTVGKQIDIWAYASLNDTPAYPDVFDGTDSAETVTSENVRNSALRLIASITVDATTDRDYFFGPVGLAQVFGGVLPKNFGLFVTHDTVAALNATGSTHVLSYTPVLAQTV